MTLVGSTFGIPHSESGDGDGFLYKTSSNSAGSLQVTFSGG